ncbi:MAG: FG-GAP-like repeat-containing protein [Anaeromyxobacter sp.]
MNGILLAFALTAGALSNYPREVGGRVGAPAVVVQLGGAPAVVVAAGDRLTALRPDGSTPAGLPLVLPALAAGEATVGAPAAADMDGDGRPELAVVTSAGRAFLWSGGAPAGWPVSLGAAAKAGPSFADVDGDGRPELVVGDVRGRVHALRRNGAEAKGFPLALGRPVTSPVASAQLGPARVLAFGCEDGRVVVVDRAGKALPGFPLVTRFAVTGAPVFADLDDDGALDVVVGSQDFSLYAVNARGQPLQGFPVAASYRIYESPAVADLDGDGRLDVLFASADGALYAVGRGGRALPGFPAKVGGRVFGGVAVGDLDRDGQLDVVAVTTDGSVVALSRTGAPLDGFPAALGGAEVTASPLLADVAGDGTPTIFVGLPGGDVQAVRSAHPGAAATAIPWAGPGRDAARSGRFGPNPPTYKDLRLEPSGPAVGDTLRAGWRGVWLDAPAGESAPAPRIEWLRDGQPVAALEGKRELPPGTARKGERWRFVLRAPAGGPAIEGPLVQVRDTAPGAPEVSVSPERPLRSGQVKATVTRAAADPDGDAVTYRIEWLLDGLPLGVEGDTLPGAKLKKGALVGARVTASDGELSGPSTLVQVRVGNTAPGTPVAAVEPASPRRTVPVRARVATPAEDVDGDALSYHYRWIVAGRPLNLAAALSELPAGLFAKKQQVQVEIRAFDGEAEGPPATAEVVAVNTPPGVPAVAIAPALPRRGQPLRAVVTAPAADDDADPVTYRFTWTRNGQPFTGAAEGGRVVPAAAVTRGDRFEVTVVASDGEVEGPPATASVQVGNTPPVPPRIALEPRRPRGGEPVKLVVQEPGKDADGDAVSLGVTWSRGGQGLPDRVGAYDLPATALRKHQRIRVTLTPRDGTDDGPAISDEIVIEDAPPTAPVIAFSDPKPTVAAPLQVALRAAAQDADGDALSYRYRWWRDGVPVPVEDGTEASRQPPYWTNSTQVPAAQLVKGQRWEVEVEAFDGEVHGPPARAAVTVLNTPPAPPRLAFAPAQPRRVDGLAVRGQQAPDADGDVITYRYRWFRDGQPFDAPADQGQIPRGTPRKGERWAVEVVAGDGEAESPPARAEVRVLGTPPGPAELALCTDGPIPSGAVPELRVTRPSVDPDGDGVSYRTVWNVNGKPVTAAAGQFRFPGNARKHDLIQVVVTPWDGELVGPPVSTECEVRNTPPGAPVIALEPAEAVARTGLQVSLRKPAPDRDGDAVTYRYAWFRDGLPVPFEGATIPASTVRHGETWRLEATPFDGEAEGERVVATTTIRNTPPAAPALTLLPDGPAVGAPLVCQLKAPQTDVDGEPITLSYRWSRDGTPVPVAEDQPTLPSGLVKHGEKWRCEAWAGDGAAESPRAVGEVVIRNTPPTAPLVQVEPERPRRGDALDCRVATASTDADGDPLTYTYAWTRDGKAAQPGADPARVEASRIAKGEKWRCTVTASDGQASAPAAHADRAVENTPPGPARVRLGPSPARAGQALRCEVTARSEDEDRDPIRYKFSWQKNGVSQPFAESSQDVPPRLVKAGDRWRCEVTPTDGVADGPEPGPKTSRSPGDRGMPPCLWHQRGRQPTACRVDCLAGNQVGS